MARDLDHFDLPRWKQALPRRKQSAGPTPGRTNRSSHGRKLVEEVERLEQDFGALPSPEGINPKLVLKLIPRPDGPALTDDTLRKLQLGLLARRADGVIVVFPDERSLSELRRRLREYAGLEADSATYAELDAIESVVATDPQERIGSRLADSPLRPNEIAPLDIELWHSGNRSECRERVAQLTGLLMEYDSCRVTDSYVGTSLCLIRARITVAAMAALLDPALDFIKEVDRRAITSYEMGALHHAAAGDLERNAEAPADDLVGILILDSGIASRHPLLQTVVGDAQVFGDSTESDTAGDVDERTPGHGTAVAGIAVYSDVGECLANSLFVPGAVVFSARVTDAQNEYDSDYLLERQLSSALKYFFDNYPAVRVINISLGDASRAYVPDEYQFRFAAAVDDLAYQYRDREVVFVVSAGNRSIANGDGEALARDYPNYLLDDDGGIIDPATSAIAVTVGGLSYGAASRLDGGEDLTDRPIAGERGWPSPFTRAGPGYNGAIKPDLVDWAGDIRFERGEARENPQWAGLPTINRGFAPPEGSLFRTVSGTSFAAPRVANLAARLFREFPGSSSNLIRCLMATSARVPSSRPPVLAPLDSTADQIRRIYGYGQADFERARWSAENDVLLLAEGNLDLDSFELFELPSLPSEFIRSKGAGEIAVCLAFDPPTRHTRMDSYLGVAMETHLFRNSPPEAVAEAIRAYSTEEKKVLRGDSEIALRKVVLPTRANLTRVDLQPGVNARKTGTLQKGVARVSTAAWTYDGNPLYLAVICRREWAPASVVSQRFAVVVSLSHENASVRLHEHIRTRARLPLRARVRA